MAAIKIKKSVGNKGKNEKADTKKIQELLNKHTKAGGFSKLSTDGIAGKKTTAAIKGFQTKAMGGKADGRVDPNGKTLGALNEKPGAASPAAPSSGGGTSGGGTSGGGTSGGGGGGGSGSSSSASKPKGKSKGSAKGSAQLQATEKELEALGEKYMEAGDRFRGAMEQVAEATQDHAVREAYSETLDDVERLLEALRRNAPTILGLMRSAILDADVKQ